MTPTELRRELSQKTGMSLHDIQLVLDCLANVMGATLDCDGAVTLPNIGKLGVTERPARQGRNPKTGAALAIPAKRVVTFATAKFLRERVA